MPGNQSGNPSSGAPSGDSARSQKGDRPIQQPAKGDDLPQGVRDAERVARELVDKAQVGRVSAQDLARMGLSLPQLQQFLADVDRARASKQPAAGGNGSTPTPTFADLIDEMNRSIKTAKKADTGTNATSSGAGHGSLRGVLDAIRETVDLQYQDILEEYYRSLADPKYRRKR